MFGTDQVRAAQWGAEDINRKGGVNGQPLEMIVQDLLLDLVERGADGSDLSDHVDAVAVFLDHAGDAPHLALDAAKAGELRLLDFLVHGLNHTPVGYR